MPLDWFNLDGKVALVTGSSSGIGAGIALGLARAGADVICHGRGEEAEATSSAIRALGRRSVVVQADLAERAAQEPFIASAVSAFGRIDLLVNNAGSIRRSPAVDYTDADWDFLLEVNLTAPFRLSRRIGKLMLEQGGGRIVNIASLLSFQGGILVPGYAASKGGVAQLTKALANEWASKNVTVNAIAPGYIATKNTEALRADPTRSRQILERIPAGRWGEPDDIAGAAVFLCSDAARYVTGQVLAVDGGWLGR
jgi:2-dehydro-3-deoxy-D-gluconate 5-dehydrogenase